MSDTTIQSDTTVQAVPARRWPLPLRLAAREISGGLRGFGIFLACLALGVWAIAGVGSISRSLSEGLGREGRTILGGDISFSLVQREAEANERAYLDSIGRVSVRGSLRGMANAGDKGSTLVDLKAIDGAYPLVGSLVTEPAGTPADLTARRGDIYGAVLEPAILAKLDLKVGDEFTLGTQRFVVAASIVSEPDKVVEGGGFAPHVLISREALDATGLIQPGSLIRWSYRIVLPEGAQADEAALQRIEAEANERFPDAGWDVRSRGNAAPNFQRNIERFTQFLALVGLTSLVVGGVGVANAVRGFIDRRRTAIAVMKSLGAPGSRIVAVNITQVMAVALIGVVIGLATGAATPYLVSALVGDALPLRLTPTIAPLELALAAAYGLIVAFTFAIVPLGRAHDIPVAALFRERVEPDGRWPRWRYLALGGAGLIALILVALFSTNQTRVAAIFLAAAAGAFVTLRLMAWGLMAAIRALPRPRRPMLRLALGNIHRPGAITPTLMMSLGLGVTLLTIVALVDANLNRQLNQSIPEQAPNFFFLDIPGSEAERFDAFIETTEPGTKLQRVPLMRGRLVSVAGTPVGEIKAADNVAWVLDGDRGLTFSDTPPEGAKIVAGSWWEKGHTGERLVSIDREIAEGLGLKVGDELTINVLGRNISAKIANLRTVEWRSLGINFVLVFSPNTFAGAPYTNLATAALPAPEATPQREAALIRALGQSFPQVTSIRVKETIEAVNEVVGKLGLAIRGASGVVLLSSVLVLAGALAAGHRARLYDAVVLKTLGATRGRLLAAYALEYGLIGLVAALIGMAAGTTASYMVIGQVMGLGFEFAWAPTLGAAFAAITVTIVLGLASAARILGDKPARHLRNA